MKTSKTKLKQTYADLGNLEAHATNLPQDFQPSWLTARMLWTHNQGSAAQSLPLNVYLNIHHHTDPVVRGTQTLAVNPESHSLH